MKNTTNQTNTTKFWSQCQEDKFVSEYLETIDKRTIKKTIVEIGAGMPEEFSNSKYFIDEGYKACLVEPNHKCYTQLVDYYKKNDQVKVYQVLIGDHEGVTELDITHAHWALGKEATESSEKKQVVGKNTLTNILDDFGQKNIGIMSIDTEGSEPLILDQLIKSKYRPDILLVESLDEQATKDIESVIGGEYELLEVLSLTRVYKCL